MPAGSTYTPIATTTLGSATPSYTFSSIPSTYTDLVLIVSAKLTSGTQDLQIRFNSDSATNYSWTYLSGSGTTAYSGRSTNQTYCTGDAYGYLDASNNNISIHNIMNYANTTTYKTMISRSNNASTGLDAVVNLWRKSPEAINTITVTNTGNTNFAIGSTFTLYGIASA